MSILRNETDDAFFTACWCLATACLVIPENVSTNLEILDYVFRQLCNQQLLNVDA